MHHSANAQDLFQLLPAVRLKELIAKWDVDKNVRSLSTEKLLRVLLLGNLFQLESFREMEGAFGVPKSTLSDACALRASGFFTDLCDEVWKLIAAHPRNKNTHRLLAIDSSECRVDGRMLKFKGWRKGSGQLAAIKFHAVLDVHAEATCDFRVTHVTASDLTTAKLFSLEKGVTYVFDRAYVDLKLWLKITACGSHFVTRLKKFPRQEIMRKHLRLDPTACGVLHDRSWTPSYTACVRNKIKQKTIKFRHVIYRDGESGKLFEFITSDFESKAEEVAETYRKRWRVELLFRWLKSHLKFRKFSPRSPNGVRVFLAVAVLLHLLICLKRLLDLPNLSLVELFRSLRATAFARAFAPGPSGSTPAPRGPPVEHLAD